MTITQYSKIQHRRGVAADLPTALDTSELGHVVDQRRLYIGNGQLVEGAPITGNTEIITNYTLLSNPTALQYVYQSNTPVIAQTGSTANAPTIRSVGQMLDDMVSIKAFGAIGDGVADDTLALNRALTNIYCVPMPNPTAAQMGYRRIYFPAGVYKISNYLYIPPYAQLIGDGLSNTVIRMSSNSATSVVRMADSLGQTDVNMGTNSATLPTNIQIEGITFQHMYDSNIVQLERVSNMHFRRCGFLGANTGSSSSSAGAILSKLGTVYTHSNITFDYCTFNYLNYGFYQDQNGANANKIYFTNCSYQNSNYGIFTSDVISDLKAVNTYFNAISKSAFVASVSASYFSSNNNTYSDCGAIGNAVILFNSGAQHCSSVNDKFFSNNGTNIYDSGTNTLVLGTEPNFTLQNMIISPKQGTITLAGTATNAATGVTFNTTTQNTVFMDYTLVIGAYTRIGRISIVTNGSSSGTAMIDMYSESTSGATGITFNYSISGSTLSVLYSSSTSSSAAWHIQTKIWQS